MSEFYLSAEAHCRRGFRVFPLLPNSKRPMIKGWPERATTDPAQVAAWWRRFPRANVAIATGDGLVVIDVDPRHGGELNPGWPSTATVRTPGGGWHLYYRCDAPVKKSVGRLAPGVDVLGEGAYVVAPGSRTPSGEYEWLPETHEIATVSASLFPTEPTPRSNIAGGQRRRFTPRESVGEGERNNYLASYAGSLYGRGFHPTEVAGYLQAENEGVCRPPLASQEVVEIAESIWRTHTSRVARSAVG
jgi:hypothetical protein